MLKRGFANIAFFILFAGIGYKLPAQAPSEDSVLGSVMDFNTRYRQTALLTGLHIQPGKSNGTGTLNYLEIGLARMIRQNGRHGPVSMGFYISEEIYPGKESIFGTKAGVFIHYMVDLGFSAVYYTDFRKGNLKLRPEWGIGIGGFRAVVGCNLPTIRNKDFLPLQKKYLQGSLQFFWVLHQKEISNQGPPWKDLFKKQKNGNR